MFFIGQDIVCIKTHPDNIVIDGQVYVVKGLKIGCCGEVKVDIGILSDSFLERCYKCRSIAFSTDNIYWLSESRFKPLDELSDISELLEVLNKENYQEV